MRWFSSHLSPFLRPLALVVLAAPGPWAGAEITVSPAASTLGSGGNCIFSVADPDGDVPAWRWRVEGAGAGTVHQGAGGKCLYFAPKVQEISQFYLLVSPADRPGTVVRVPILVTPRVRPSQAASSPAPIDEDETLMEDSEDRRLSGTGAGAGSRHSKRVRKSDPGQGEHPDAAQASKKHKIAAASSGAAAASSSSSAAAASASSSAAAASASSSAAAASASSSAAAASASSSAAAASASSSAAAASASSPAPTSADGAYQDLAFVAVEAGEELTHRKRLSRVINPASLRVASDDPSETLGEGTYGAIQKVMDAEGRIAVRKVFSRRVVEKCDRRGNSSLKYVDNEIEIMKSLSHPNIIKFMGHHKDHKNIYLTMELAEQPLDKLAYPHGLGDEALIANYTKQILLGLEYLHSQGVVHGDLKSFNILINAEGVVKIIDFGSAKRFNLHDRKDLVPMEGPDHTVLWAAPEMFGPAGGYRQDVDVWALGCVLIEMLIGKEPWHELAFPGVYPAVLYFAKTPDAVPVIPANASDALRKFAARCLVRDPEGRATPTELLKDPFIVGSAGAGAAASSR